MACAHAQTRTLGWCPWVLLGSFSCWPARASTCCCVSGCQRLQFRQGQLNACGGACGGASGGNSASSGRGSAYCNSAKASGCDRARGGTSSSVSGCGSACSSIKTKGCAEVSATHLTALQRTHKPLHRARAHVHSENSPRPLRPPLPSPPRSRPRPPPPRTPPVQAPLAPPPHPPSRTPPHAHLPVHLAPIPVAGSNCLLFISLTASYTSHASPASRLTRTRGQRTWSMPTRYKPSRRTSRRSCPIARE
jgi:hypothetical protein